jgi:hypothetical protein
MFLCEIANKIVYTNAQGYVCYHRLLVKIHQNRLFFFFFFLNAIPVFCHTAFTVPFRGRRFFLFPIPFCLSSPSFRWCDGAPGHFPRPPTPIPPHIHRHTQHLYTHGRLFPTGLEPVLTSRWWPKEC